MDHRSLDEALIDRLLLLYLVTRTRKKGYNILGPIKLQKLLYKIEEQMFRKDCKGLSYTFIRWKHGPFSQEVYSDVKDLKATGFLNAEDVASTSRKGQEMAKIAENILDPEVKDIIERVLNEFGPLSGKQLKEVMYSYPIVDEKRTIREAKEGELILSKLTEEKARKCIRVNERLLETLSIMFNPSAYKAIRNSLDAMKKEEPKRFIPVRN